MDLTVKMLLFLLIIPCPSFSKRKKCRDTLGLRTTVSSLVNETEELMTSMWMTQFVPSVYTIVVALSLPLNIMAIVVFLTKIKIKKPPVVYMISLAFADVFLASVLPFQISYYFSGNKWTLGPEMLIFARVAFFCNMYCSMLMMMVISIDRFLAVVYPVQSLPWRTVNCASMTCSSIWLAAIIVAVIPVFFTRQQFRTPMLNITICRHLKPSSNAKKILRYYYCIVPVFLFLIPLIISAICYMCIIRYLHLSNVSLGKKRRGTFLSATVLCCFIVCFGPANVLQIVQSVNLLLGKRVENLEFPRRLSRCIGIVNCCIDPLLYYYASSEYRRYVWKLLCGNHHSEFGKGNWTTSSNKGTLTQA